MINSIKKVKNLKSKKVLLRLDLNVQIKNGKIMDDYRLIAAIDTIHYLLAKKAKLIIITHLGRAKGKFDEQYSLKPVAARLRAITKQKISFVNEYEPKKSKVFVDELKEGEAIMLDNLRFNEGEIKNESKFAKELASLADIYVNEAFSVCHRSQASVDAVKKYLPSYAGLLLEQEVVALNKILKPKKPFVAILGGSKIETKAPLIEKFLNKADKVIIGGALANTIIKEMGFEIGKSLCDDNASLLVKKIFKIKNFEDKLVLPVDFVVMARGGKKKLVRPDEVNKSN